MTTPTPNERNPYAQPVATQAAVAHAQAWQPPGLFLLFIVEMWERFSYYGMRALLVLYLYRSITGSEAIDGGVAGFNPGRGWPKSDATQAYGWYVGLAYLLPILGGLVADKLIGTHRSMVVGGIVIALGHIALAVSGLGEWHSNHVGMSIFIGGLALIVMGTGHFKPCVSVMVGQLYPSKDDPRRDGGFSIFYMGINLGAFVGTLLCGYLGEMVGWHWGFGAAAVGMILGLGVYFIGRPLYLVGVGLPPPGKPNLSIPFVLLACAIATGVGVFFHQGGFTEIVDGMTWITDTVGKMWVVIALLAIVGVLVAWLLASQESKDIPVVAAILTFILFNTFFWMAFEQAGSTLNIFADEETDRMIGTYEVPATWFQSINPFLILILSIPFALMWGFLSKRRIEPRQAGKIGIGLILLGLGFMFMAFGGKFASEGVKVSMFWLLATYTVHTVAELFLSPTGLSFVTKTAPLKFMSLLMGIWFLSSFLAGVIGGQIGSYVERIEAGETQVPWSGWFGGQGDFFFLFVVTSVGAGVLCLVLGPILNRMSKEV